MKGGYLVIDLKDAPLSAGVGKKIDGIYDKIKDSYRKPIMLSNITYGNVERADRYVAFDSYDGTFYGIYGLTKAGELIKISVDKNNTVTIIE